MTNRTDTTTDISDDILVGLGVAVRGGTWRWQWNWSTAGATRTW